jgi:hypothetical protein
MRDKLTIVGTLISVVMLLGNPSLSHPQPPTGQASGAAPPVVSTQGSDWTVTIDQDAAVVIKHKGTPVVGMSYVLWGVKTAWAGLDIRVEPEPGGRLALAGRSPVMKITVSGAVSSDSPDQLAIDYQFHSPQRFSGVTGGGIEWHPNLASPSFGGRLPDPVLLDDSTGWAWQVAGGRPLTVRADPPFPKVYFERDRKNQIRTFFYSGQIPAGPRRVRLTITLPEGGRRELSAIERYGWRDTRSWYHDALHWDSSPVDLRFLNRDERPAGRHGFIKADGDRLVFQDGTPARFWGANLAAYALFHTPHENVARQARRMAQLGYNLVRFPHHDSAWVKPNIFEPSSSDTRHLSPTSLDLLDWWIKCLKDEGIYIWLDMNVGRTLRPGDRVSLGHDEVMRKGAQVLGFNYFNPDIQKLMIEFQHSYLKHVNRYTRLAYKDDPALIGVLITNENDLTQHHGNLMLPDKNNPAHNEVFTRGYKEFAGKYGLPEKRVFETWLPGPSKLFLNEAEHQFNLTMINDLRQLGVKATIVTTDFWGGGSLFSLPALTDGDVINAHSYGKSEAFDTNPRYVANYIAWIGAAQVYGKPLVVSEWNLLQRDPRTDRFTAPLYVASIAALQGWDAPMLFSYSQTELELSNHLDAWSTFKDPAITGMMPAAALAYRQGHISPARTTYCLLLEPEQYFGQAVNPDTSATIRTLMEQSRLTIGLPAVKELPWLKPTLPKEATIVNDPNRDFIPEGQSFVRSDTGEITRDWQLGIQTLDAERSQAVSGWIGGKTLKTRDATFRFKTNKAVVALTSVDNRPLADSRFILISAMARVTGERGRPGAGTFSEPVVGTISLRTSLDNLQLLALASDGRVVGRSTPGRSEGALNITIPAGRGTHWFVLKASEPAKDSAQARGQSGD